MDRYTKVEQKKPDVPINENEIRITSQGLVRNYISYATTLIQERRGKEIVLKAMGQAISKTVAIAEIIKRNIRRLHQDTKISSISITDVWEPIEEGLLPVEMTRLVSMISITLSTKELNKNSPGYQAPLYVERPRPQYNNYQRQQQPQQAYNEEPYGGGYHGNRGRGQGGGIRGGRGRGWNRGGYGNQGGGYGSHQGGDGYRNYQGGGRDGYKNHQGGGGNGYANYQGSGGYGSYQGGKGYGNYRAGRGNGNYQGGGGGGDEYANYQGSGEYGNNQVDKNGYLNNGRGGGRGGYAGYRGGGYMRGGSGGRGGGGGRFNGRGRGRMGGRPRDGGDPQQQ